MSGRIRPSSFKTPSFRVSFFFGASSRLILWPESVNSQSHALQLNRINFENKIVNCFDSFSECDRCDSLHRVSFYFNWFFGGINNSNCRNDEKRHTNEPINECDTQVS